MNVKIETITPEIAESYLKRNTNNYRSIDSWTVKMYADDMAAGRWQFNGESIRFSKSGELIDGQHRLKAIVKAKVPVKMLVVRDVDDEVSIYDVGKGRTSAQILSANEIEKSVRGTTIIGAASIILTSTFSAQKVSKPLLLNYLRNNQDIWSGIYKLITSGKGGPAICRKSPVAAACFVLGRNGAEYDDLRDFFTVVNTGFPIESRECSAAIVLRNTLLSETRAVSSFRDVRTLQYCATVQAFLDFSVEKKRRRAYSVDDFSLRLLKKECKIATDKC